MGKPNELQKEVFLQLLQHFGRIEIISKFKM